MRLAICDDHPLVVLSTKLLMEAHGHQVVSTVCRPELLASTVDRHQPDACIVDLLFGSRDPAPALAAIEDVSARTAVVVLSGSVDAAQHQAALAAGATAVASKSVAAAELMALVEGRPVHRPAQPPRRQVNPHGLTARELEVLDHLVDGTSTAAIAQLIGVKPATARSHVQNLMAKMGVRTRAAAVARGINDGFAFAS